MVRASRWYPGTNSTIQINRPLKPAPQRFIVESSYGPIQTVSASLEQTLNNADGNTVDLRDLRDGHPIIKPGPNPGDVRWWDKTCHGFAAATLNNSVQSAAGSDQRRQHAGLANQLLRPPCEFIGRPLLQNFLPRK